jgi:PAS domain S-box-containing protein
MRLALLLSASLVVFAVDFMLPLGIATAVLYTLIVIGAVGLGRPRVVWGLALLCSILTVADCVSARDSIEPLWAVALNRALCLLSVWVTAWIGLVLMREHEQRARIQVSLNESSASLETLRREDARIREAVDQLKTRIGNHSNELQRLELAREVEGSLRADAERALHLSDARLRAVLDNAVEAIVTTDESGCIEFFNRAAEKLFGWPQAEAIGRNVTILMPLPHSSEHDGYFQRYLDSGRKSVIGMSGRRVTGKRKDGSIFSLEISITEFRDGQRGFAAVMRDLTERQRQDEQLRQAQKMEAVGRLATGIAHDFNNLLMGVLGCARIAQRSLASDHPAMEMVDEIRAAVERGANLSRQLLAYSRQRPAEVELLRLNDVVGAIERMLRPVIGEDIQLELELCPSGGSIYANAAKIEQVLMNLAVNARAAMPAGGRLRIATRDLEFERPVHTRTKDLTPGRWVVLEVSDTGCGMSEHVLAHLFEPFFTTKPVDQGTGLGLYTVYGILEQFGAGVDVESRVGAGTTFKIHFPWQPQPSTGAPAEPASGAVVEGGGDGETILVVEDERLVRATLEHTLTSLGYRVLVAADAEEALRRSDAHKGAIDLLLSDMVLPGLNGSELARKLRARRPELRTVFMSAHPNDVLIAEGRIEPGVFTLEKPFTEEHLVERLRDALASTSAA